MSTISKTNPNTNQSSKTQNGLNNDDDIDILSTLTPPVTIYGLAPQLRIGSNFVDSSTYIYSANTIQITTQDNSYLKLDATKSYLNKNLSVYTGTDAYINLGPSISNDGEIVYAQYSPGLWLLQLSTQFGTSIQLQNEQVFVNKDLQVLKDMPILGNINFSLQNATGYNIERQAIFKYTEIIPSIDDEGAQLEISVPANTRSIPTTPGSRIDLLQDQNISTCGSSSITINDGLIVLDSDEVQLDVTGLNTDSYIYLNSLKVLTNIQPAPLSWTPTIVYTTPGTNSLVYTTQFGRIWKYGNVSYFTFRILVTITITGATNLRINGSTTYPAITNPTNIKMGPVSTIGGVRYDTNCISENSQTTPNWIITLLFSGGLLPAHAAWVPGVGVSVCDFYGDGFLCHG